VIATAKLTTVPATGRAAYVMPPKEAPGALGTKVVPKFSEAPPPELGAGRPPPPPPAPNIGPAPWLEATGEPAPGARQNRPALPPLSSPPRAPGSAAAAAAVVRGSAKGEARAVRRGNWPRGGGAAGGVSALAELEAEEGGSCTMRSGTIAVGGTSAASRSLSAALAANAPTAAAAAPARSPARAAAEQRVHGAQQDELYLASRARDRVRARREERARGEGLID
jgi:hypothetical protein